MNPTPASGVQAPMEISPGSGQSGQITLQFSRRSLIVAVLIFAGAIVPLALGTAALGGYFVWTHFDHQSRLNQAAVTHAETFAAEFRSFDSLLSAAELQKRELDAAFSAAQAASKAGAIPVERLTAEADTLRAAARRLDRSIADLPAIEPRLRDQFNLRPGDRFVSATDEATLRTVRDRIGQLTASVDRIPGQLAAVVARRDELISQAAAEQKALAQRRAAQQRAAAQKAAAQRASPAATVVREVIVARPAPVFSVGFGTFGPGYGYRHPYYQPVWGHSGYRPYRYQHCPQTGTRVGFGVAFSSR